MSGISGSATIDRMDRIDFKRVVISAAAMGVAIGIFSSYSAAYGVEGRPRFLFGVAIASVVNITVYALLGLKKTS